MSKIGIRRSRAAALIERIAVLVVEAREMGRLKDLPDDIENLLSEEGIPLPTKCPGEAHDNVHIDNCPLCAKHCSWGWVWPDGGVKVT